MAGGGPRTAMKRIMREYIEIEEEAVPGISISFPDESNVFIWQVIIAGPDDTIWDGGVFKLRVHFPENYPFKPPKVFFTPPVYHPNVYPKDGNVCLDLLQKNYDPAYNMRHLLIALQQLLSTPNPDSPANNISGKDLTDNLEAYEKLVRDEVEKSWKRFD